MDYRVLWITATLAILIPHICVAEQALSSDSPEKLLDKVLHLTRTILGTRSKSPFKKAQCLKAVTLLYRHSIADQSNPLSDNAYEARAKLIKHCPTKILVGIPEQNI